MSRLLQAFARIYQKSASGRHGSARDHTIDHEKFLRLAATNPGVLPVLTSNPGSAVLRLIERLPADLPPHHYGDKGNFGQETIAAAEVWKALAHAIKPPES